MTAPAAPSNPDAAGSADGTGSAVRNVVLGVAGGIAAYKAVSLLRLLREAGHAVRVVPTPSALTFVGAATWEALSGQPVRTGVFDAVTEVEHVTLGRNADLVVVAPATADLLARATAGRANDLLTACLLTTRAPVVLVPAMHTEMWEHPATRANVARLRERGTVVLEPATGRLTGGDSGVGRLPDPDEIYAALRGFLTLPAARDGAHRADLADRRVLVTAGGTREPLDPVRFLANRSSGRQGFAVAAAAAARGADVHVIAANTSAAAPAGVLVTHVETTQELADAVTAAAPAADVVVMAAAPADYRPAHRSAEKIKKTGGRTGRRGAKTPGTLVLELVENPDILAGLAAVRRPGQVIVGFAAETGDESGTPLDYGRAKLAAKGADFMLVNEVGVTLGFGTAENSGILLGSDGSSATVPIGPKESVGHAILDAVASRLVDTSDTDQPPHVA
ncbi:MAG TPA: bifunctional phosphopantothenoylcysteine decarboxylase/phosphopantothenate--cysteine ligase CoaBC [Actinopolymorphaceae bacterium]|jgi:phosphopantothenoylcysteine decarboxylase/phosphopantothenate--cysteine ligase